MPFAFEYDPEKASANLLKHGVSFTEAMSVFTDPLASELLDDAHSEGETRYITVGMSTKRRLLFVVYTERESRIRLIGARLANAREQTQYEQTC